MTPEQVELELEFIEVDRLSAKGNEVYEDTEFDDYDNESEERDSVIADDDEASEPYVPKKVEIDDSWEAVEIDDFDEDEEPLR